MRISCITLLSLLGALLCSDPFVTPASAAAATIQASNLKANTARANAVRSLYNSTFANYLRYAKGADELFPVSRKPQNNFLGHWGATMVDSISTSYLMGLTNYVKVAEDWMVNKVDYTKTPEAQISVFETTIRHVAGLISAYELGGKKNQGLIRQATTLADILLHAWLPGADLPYNTLTNWNTSARPAITSRRQAVASIAEAGTLILEFDRLSKYSGNNPKYRAYAKRAEDALNRAEGNLPGLRVQEYKVFYPSGSTDGQLESNTALTSFGGGSDSFIEYQLKYALLTGNPSSPYLKTWITGIKSAIKYLVQSPQSHNTTFYLSDLEAHDILPQYSHLACFAPGNILLGAKALANDALLQWGLKLAQSCIDTYRATPSAIGPESWSYVLRDGSTNGVSYTDDAFSRVSGFSVGAPSYVLRPEVVESAFYAYRLTGEAKWAEYVWEAFVAIRRHCGTADGSLSAIDDVTKADPDQIDNLQSFAFAELFKYMYLTFADPAVGSLDKYVFNTEAHPFLRDKPSADFTRISVGTVPTPLMRSRI
ncbi:hypothetical protein V8E36_000755 [Tilletia maclaganii]